MTTTHYKRFRMEIDLQKFPPEQKELPEGYMWMPWSIRLLDMHARTKKACFEYEIDAHVFPCLAELTGCRKLMRDMASRSTFVPEATWLVLKEAGDDQPVEHCGTIQGIHTGYQFGAIQNVGIVPEHRGHGLGKLLVLQSLHGFLKRGVKTVSLEVTAQNTKAVRLYHSIGFRIVKTLYKTAKGPVPKPRPKPSVAPEEPAITGAAT